MDIYESYREKIEKILPEWKKVSWEKVDTDALLWLAQKLRNIATEAENEASEITAEIGLGSKE